MQRYLSQVKELDQLAGPDHVIKVPACESSQTNDLLRVLGYRMRGGCGSEVVLETVNAARAFLTTDSGFPLIGSGKRAADRPPVRLSLSFDDRRGHVSGDYWMNAKEKAQGNFLDALLGDPALCRFYLGMSRLDPETAADSAEGQSRRCACADSPPCWISSAAISRSARARRWCPAAPEPPQAWAELAGASPDKGAEFFDKLMSRDDGWLAGLYDALARIHGPVQDYLTDPVRMKRFYAAIRGKVTTPGPARPVFNSNTDLMLLTTRLRLDPDGQPHIPGGLECLEGPVLQRFKGKVRPEAECRRAELETTGRRSGSALRPVP